MMFTTQNTVDEVVLKSVAFQHSVGLDPSRVLLQRPPSAVWAGQTTPTSLENEVNTPSVRRQVPQRKDAAGEAPVFTFTVPLRGTTAQNSLSFTRLPTDALREEAPRRRRHQQLLQDVPFAARSALREALERHEDALRAWADEPMLQLPPTRLNALPRPAPTTLSQVNTTAAQLPSRVRRSVYDTQAYPASASSGVAQNVSAAACAVKPSRLTWSVTQPYCRVLAKDSMAGIGLPPRRRSSEGEDKNTDVVRPSRTEAVAHHAVPAISAEGSDASVKKRAVHVSSRASSRVEDVYAASPSSLSDVESEVHYTRREHEGDGPAVAAAATQGAPLYPYQLPLRMRPDAEVAPLAARDDGGCPQPGLHASGITSPQERGGGAGEDAERHTFLREQAARYAQWRSRQAAVLRQLAPDMWGRVLLPYAALDSTPPVMDSSLRNIASMARQFQHDTGVVYA